jgi:SAM-dependent methyltransferase
MNTWPLLEKVFRNSPAELSTERELKAVMSESTSVAQTNATEAGSTSPLCPVCAARDNRFWGLKTAHVIFECNTCGVVFFNRELFETHKYGNYYDYTDDWDTARVAWEVRIRTRALKRQLTRLGSYVQGRNLVDIGAGPGYLCHVAALEGWQAQGVEMSEKALRIGRQFLGVDYIQLDDIPDQSLDVITCYHILEHMEEPSGLLRKVHSKLKANGVVAVHVPHREPLSFLIRNRLTVLKRGGREKDCQLYVPEHISGFTKESLVNTLRLFQFEPLMVRTSAMWSCYYDPFFVRNFVNHHEYAGLIKHGLRSLIDNVGVAVGKGDWVVGHFRKTS